MNWTIFTLIFICLKFANSIIHERSLVWTLRSHSSQDVKFDILGVLGDPTDWARNGYSRYSYSYFGEYEYRNNSRRDALSFDYVNKRLFFTDNGFRAVFKTTVQEASTIPYEYNSTMRTVYSPTSSGVDALAFDWASGSLYWADSILNIIKVANPNLLNIAKTIVSEDLETPKGIAVFPKKGLLYWTNKKGPRIESSQLDGQGRRIIVNKDLVDPTTLSLDQDTNALFFVDSAKRTLERIDLNTMARFAVEIRGKPVLSGISHFQDFIFIADQRTSCIEILNKTNFDHVTNIGAGLHSGLATPFDLRMYDQSLQRPLYSDCDGLDCEHICISDGGQKAHCICADGFLVSALNPTKCVLPSVCSTLKCEYECVVDQNNQPKCLCPLATQLVNSTHCEAVKLGTNELVVAPPTLPTPALIAIVVIIALLAILVLTFVMVMLLRRKRKRKPDPLTPSVSYLSDTNSTTIIKTYVCEHREVKCCHNDNVRATAIDYVTDKKLRDEVVYSEIDDKKAAKSKTAAGDLESAKNEYNFDPFEKLDQPYENQGNGIVDFNPFNFAGTNKNVGFNEAANNYEGKEDTSLSLETASNINNFENAFNSSKENRFEAGNYISEILSGDLMQQIVAVENDDNLNNEMIQMSKRNDQDSMNPLSKRNDQDSMIQISKGKDQDSMIQISKGKDQDNAKNSLENSSERNKLFGAETIINPPVVQPDVISEDDEVLRLRNNATDDVKRKSIYLPDATVSSSSDQNLT